MCSGYLREASRGLVLLRIRAKHAGNLPSGSLENASDTGSRGRDHADQLATQLVQRRQGGKGLDAFDVQGLTVERSTEDLQLVVGLGEVGDDLGGGDRISRGGNTGRADEQIGNTFVRYPEGRAW